MSRWLLTSLCALVYSRGAGEKQNWYMNHHKYACVISSADIRTQTATPRYEVISIFAVHLWCGVVQPICWINKKTYKQNIPLHPESRSLYENLKKIQVSIHLTSYEQICFLKSLSFCASNREARKYFNLILFPENVN